MFCDRSIVLLHFKLGIILTLHVFLTSFVTAYGLYDDGTSIPYFNPRPNNLTYYRGDTAILQCSIQHLGTKTVIWRRASDPNPVTIGEQVYVGNPRYSLQQLKEKGEWNLVIKNVVPEDSGVYECQVSSRKKIIWHILLRVNASTNPQRVNSEYFKNGRDKPQSTVPAIFVSGTTFVEKGDPIHIVCNATGSVNPPQDLDWFKDGIKITPDAHQKITIEKFQSLPTKTIVSVLQLKHSNMNDAGTYVCRSSNLDITSIKVHVLNAGSLNVKRTSTEDEDKSSGQTSVVCFRTLHFTATLLVLTVINIIH
ncbi:zwei Ig domain protein zig-8-like isoform X2 [Haliotis cracherodii]|uniref:zwei Ig domain protein zig-8-like isoform X2 n=1 Tax=Haliotis cracherodii TaxID=6455 RepID=UPI0039E8E4F3